MSGPSERSVLEYARLRLGGHPHIRLWRNNVGRLPDRNGRWVTYGLCVGSADLIGIVSPHGRLLSIECKGTAGRESAGQRVWRRVVEGMGGYHATVRSVADVDRVLEELTARGPAA